MGLLLIWMLFGIIAAIIGARKGEGFKAFILGSTFGPIGVVLAQISKGTRAKCPVCEELIELEAIKCPRCMSDLSE